MPFIKCDIFVLSFYLRIMLSANRRSSQLPLTPAKLNHFLSQYKKKQKNKQSLQQNLSAVLPGQNSQFYGQQNRYQNPAPDPRNNAIYSIKQTQMMPRMESPYLYNNSSTISVNANEPIPPPFNYNDSLDVLMTDRLSHKDQTMPASPIRQRKRDPSSERNYFNREELQTYGNPGSELDFSAQYVQNESELVKLSPRHILNPKNDIRYYQRKNQQERPERKVNWSLEPKPVKIQRRSIYRSNLNKSFKQISHQLSKITYELNQNSKKLEQMSKLYPPIKKVKPRDSLKRANLKYSVCMNENSDDPGFRRRPYVKYEDREYKDPRSIIWQPLHQKNFQTIFS